MPSASVLRVKLQSADEDVSLNYVDVGVGCIERGKRAVPKQPQQVA